VSNVSLMPVPSEQSSATCANCGAPLVADQRYCLSCGQPVSPVRLAFLDVLGNEAKSQPNQQAWGPPPIEVGPGGYVLGPGGPEGWLRRYSGVLGLLSVLAICLLAGLLIGHWASQGSGTPAQQVIKVEGLGGLGSGGASTGTPGTSTGSEESTATEESSKPATKSEKKEAEEGEHETAAEKAPPPAPKKIEKQKLEKLTKSKGKKHEEEINELGDTPIET
jgi:hypothetical protein